MRLRWLTWLRSRMRPEWLREQLFRLSVLIKGFDGVVELLGGVVLLFVTPGFIFKTVASLTQEELLQDPHDLVANLLLRIARHLSVSSEHFAAIYLLVHGVVKLALVEALLRMRLWAFPVSEVVFTGFIAYQVYRFTLTGSLGLIALSVFDALVIGLIYLEHRALKARLALQSPGGSHRARGGT